MPFPVSKNHPEPKDKAAQWIRYALIPWARRRWIMITIIALVLVLAYDLLPFGGNLRFYSKWVECGQKPLAANYEWNYRDVPYYGSPPTFSLVRLYPEYFCTPLEAERAGYSASSDQYEFPHLEKSNNSPIDQ